MSQRIENETDAVEKTGNVVNIAGDPKETAQPVPTVWKYNGFEFEFDITDADDSARFEEAMRKLDTSEKSLKKDGSLSERIIEYDKMFRDLYDFLFGEGAGDDILGERRSMTNCQDSYESLLDYINQQSVAMGARRAALLTRYSGNRAQRRADARNSRRR